MQPAIHAIGSKQHMRRQQAAVTYKQQRDNNFNNASGLKIHNGT
jgi:hypothetical protein